MNDLKERMYILKMNKEELSRKSLVDEDLIIALINNEKDIRSIHELDLELLSQSLMVDTSYFLNKKNKEKDWVFISFKNGGNYENILKTKGKMQRLAKDYIFLKNI